MILGDIFTEILLQKTFTGKYLVLAELKKSMDSKGMDSGNFFHIGIVSES